jgi:hypothetical protein
VVFAASVAVISNPIPAAATAHAFKFGQVTSSTGQVWMDRNLGASQVAIAKSASPFKTSTSNWQLQYRVKSTCCWIISRIPNIFFWLPVAGTRLKWTGRLGNMGNVAYYWTRSVPDSQLYRYARYLYFGKHSTHPAFYNVERSEGKKGKHYYHQSWQGMHYAKHHHHLYLEASNHKNFVNQLW